MSSQSAISVCPAPSLCHQCSGYHAHGCTHFPLLTQQAAAKGSLPGCVQVLTQPLDKTVASLRREILSVEGSDNDSNIAMCLSLVRIYWLHKGQWQALLSSFPKGLRQDVEATLARMSLRGEPLWLPGKLSRLSLRHTAKFGTGWLAKVGTRLTRHTLGRLPAS